MGSSALADLRRVDNDPARSIGLQRICDLGGGQRLERTRHAAVRADDFASLLTRNSNYGHAASGSSRHGTDACHDQAATPQRLLLKGELLQTVNCGLAQSAGRMKVVLYYRVAVTRQTFVKRSEISPHERRSRRRN